MENTVLYRSACLKLVLEVDSKWIGGPSAVFCGADDAMLDTDGVGKVHDFSKE